MAMKQRALQSRMAEALPGVDVTAVGRIADFDRALAANPDAVLSLPLVLDSRGLAPALRGARQGKTDEEWVLAAEGTAPTAARVTSVGALDLLGRQGTAQFVKDLLAASAKVERVTKVEDLLPLLQMRRVECIVLPGRLFSSLRGMSRMNLVSTSLETRVGLPAVASTGAGGPLLLKAIRALTGASASTLGVDSWR